MKANTRPQADGRGLTGKLHKAGNTNSHFNMNFFILPETSLECDDASGATTTAGEKTGSLSARHRMRMIRSHENDSSLGGIGVVVVGGGCPRHTPTAVTPDLCPFRPAGPKQ